VTVIQLDRWRHGQPPTVPAFGSCPRCGWRRGVVVVAGLAALLALALVVRTSGILRPPPADRSLPPLSGVATVAPGLVRGGQPNDFEILHLRDDYGVRGLIDVDGMNVEEQAVARGLHLRCLQLHVADGRPPTADQLLRLVQFLRSTAASRPSDQGTGVVYMHDVTGRGPVLVVAAMLQLLHGIALPAVLDKLSRDAASRFTKEELLALHQLDAVARGGTADGPYGPLRGVTW
jgi:hypothetical protein